MNKPKMNNEEWLVNALKNLENISYYLKRKFIEEGYVLIREIKLESRGRPRKEYFLSEKGLNASKG
ncbi:MAG: hypothetical protein COA52_00560 [Hyphomicrobiales bacterium]|nr:MAG: hypothetical protein COA52_00560 [Hyphomicrobiales bacterium]